MLLRVVLRQLALAHILRATLQMNGVHGGGLNKTEENFVLSQLQEEAEQLLGLIMKFSAPCGSCATGEHVIGLTKGDRIWCLVPRGDHAGGKHANCLYESNRKSLTEFSVTSFFRGLIQKKTRHPAQWKGKYVQPKRLGQAKRDALADVGGFAVAVMGTLRRLQEAVDRKEPTAPTFRPTLLLHAASYANVRPHAHLNTVMTLTVSGAVAAANSLPECGFCLGALAESSHKSGCDHHVVCNGCYEHLRGEDLYPVFSVLVDTVYVDEGLIQSQLTGGCLLCASAL